MDKQRITELETIIAQLMPIYTKYYKLIKQPEPKLQQPTKEVAAIMKAKK